MARPEKVKKVDEIQQLFKESDAYFVTDYQGLNVADITVLRKNLRESRVRYMVAKNTLFRLAAEGAGEGRLKDHFQGPTAVAFTQEEPAVAAKILHDSYKERELPRIKAFVLDDQIYDGAEIKRLADLPPRDVLLSQVVAAVESPLTSLVASVQAVFRELIGTVDALAEKRKAEE